MAFERKRINFLMDHPSLSPEFKKLLAASLGDNLIKRNSEWFAPNTSRWFLSPDLNPYWNAKTDRREKNPEDLRSSDACFSWAWDYAGVSDLVLNDRVPANPDRRSALICSLDPVFATAS